MESFTMTLRATPAPQVPADTRRTGPAQVRPVYVERDSMRDFERLTPFIGDTSQWRNWSQKARCAARAAYLERVMTGKAPRPDDAEGFEQ